MDMLSRTLIHLRGAYEWTEGRAKLALSYVSYARSFLRAPTYVRERWTGRQPLAGARRVAVFVHYDRRGIVHEFVYRHLRQLANTGFSIIFVSNAPRLSDETRERLKPVCALILRRANVGYDFGAYKEGIAAIPDVTALDLLILANDSVYGPLHHPARVLENMGPEGADVWGASDSWEHSFHLQSYFLVFHRAALVSPSFSRFWTSLTYVQSKTWIVRRYEIGLTRAMSRAGLRCRAAYPYRDAAAALVQAVMDGAFNDPTVDPVRKAYAEQLFRAIDRGVPLNSTHFFWDHLIARMGFPFVKRDLLQKNPVRIPLLSYWERVIRDASDYDTDLILRHLELTLRNRTV